MSLRLWTILTVAVAIAAPAAAQDGARRRRGDNPRNQDQQTARAPERAEGRDRAVPRASAQTSRPESRAVQPAPRAETAQPAPQARRDSHGASDGRHDSRGYDRNRRYDYGRAVPRRHTPRIVRPVVVRVIPYRPYVYRPSYRAGVVYGSNGYYPYGYTPRGYYDPLPGRPYGGLRITGAPRWARVFADGYYVGLVNDFDGIFQHLNLEAGPHRIEIEDEGLGAIAFDVFIRPGETITYRAGY
jgi:hypothetical protein